MNIARWGLAVNDAGHLVLGGCDIVDLADRYGTPLHVVDEAALRRTYRSFVQSFSASYPRVDVFYSYKSNCVPGVLAILHSEGCGAEVISPYELWLARRLGVDPSRIIYNGVNKSFEDLRGAIEVGVRLVNVDSLGRSGGYSRSRRSSGGRWTSVSVSIRAWAGKRISGSSPVTIGLSPYAVSSPPRAS